MSCLKAENANNKLFFFTHSMKYLKIIQQEIKEVFFVVENFYEGGLR